MRERGETAVLTDCAQQHSPDVRRILPAVARLLGPSHTGPLSLMCVGMPNVGKSSLLNALRRTHAKKG